MKTGFQKTFCDREMTAFLAALPALSPKAAALASDELPCAEKDCDLP
ncbi:hypothetical protein [Bacillus spizizenii]|nr:hypothetical protein [Bacillus spizizenii]